MKALELFSRGVKIAGGYISKNSPSILMALGIGGMVAAVVVAIHEPIKVEEEIYLLEKDELHKADEKEQGEPIKHPVWPRVKIYAKHYWPTAAIVVSSAGCLIFANRINLKRNAALLAAYQLSAMNLKDIREKIVEMDGEKKLQKVNDAIAKDKVEASSPSTIVISGEGEHLIYDVPSGRYFMGNIERIRQAVNEINKNLYNYNYASLNDFYDYVGLDHIGTGYKLGWHMNTTDDLLEMEYSSQITKDGRPCLVIKYDVKPIYDFDY